MGRPSATTPSATVYTSVISASRPRSDGPSQRASSNDATKPTARLPTVPRTLRVTERASTGGGGSDLSLGPRLLYPAKAAVTRGRSLLWAVRGGASTPGLRMLFYHRVADADDELAVGPGAFRAQMEWL